MKIIVLITILIFFINISLSIKINNQPHNNINIQNNNPKDNEFYNKINDKFGYDTNGTKCDICKYGIDEVQKMINSAEGEEDIKTWVTNLCTYLHIEKAEVCEGLIPLFTNMTFEVLSYKGVTGDYVCGFVGFCPYVPNGNPSNIINFPKPKPPHVAPVPPTSNAPTMKILHISDIHVDPDYTVGTNADCGEPLCCRAPNGPGTGKNMAGVWGHYKCDINMKMVESMFEFIDKEFGNEIEIVFWTGDNPPHDIWEQTYDSQINSSLLVTNLVRKYFGNSKVIPAIGNHESLPVNAFPLPPGSSWIFNALSYDWSDWINVEDQVKLLQYGGYYTLPIQPGLRALSLNMNWCNNGNMYLVENSTDPANMLQWIVETLQASEDIAEKVYIVGHIPPGIPDCIDNWSEQLYQIVNRYEDTIIGSFYGHTHRDEFSVYYVNENDDQSSSSSSPSSKRPSNVLYVTPSVTTYQNQNPSFRIFTVDANTGYLIESSTYHTDLDQANLNGEPTWLLEYNATTSYNIPDLTPTSWNVAINNFNSSESLLQLYYDHYYSSSPYPESKPCNSVSCKLDFICKMKSASYLKYYQCVHEHVNIDTHLLSDSNESDSIKFENRLNILLNLINYLNNDVLKSC